jgi:hypothetical protein
MDRHEDPKHDRYRDVQCPGDVFWGIGIENETYVEVEGGVPVIADIVKKQARERYSVNYWGQYKTGEVDTLLDRWISRLPGGANTPLTLPLLLNGHTLTKCDRYGEHKTVYGKVPKPNPKFRGTTLYEDLSGVAPEVFGPNALDRWWCFDGDTVEFMTQDYYCVTIEDVVGELIEAKTRWIAALQKGLKTIPVERLLRSPVRFPTRNYGLAVFLTNRRNVAIFNNGTFHLNMTAPTRLDKNGEIEDWAAFQAIHQRVARLFQWISPFLVAKYGSPDVFAHLAGPNSRYPTGSQRLAASRYVSVGTYDTTKMIRGKLLTKPVSEVRCDWWHQMYGQPGCAYKPLEVIGFDVNFNKFNNHGLEFRIFDWFPEAGLMDLMRLLVWLFDHASSVKEVPIPQDSAVWNRVLRRCVWNGANVWISSGELRVFREALGCPLMGDSSGSLHILDCLNNIWNHYADRYNKHGPCSSKMIRHGLFRPLVPKLTWMREIVPRKKPNRDILRVTLKTFPIRKIVPLRVPVLKPLVEISVPKPVTYRPFLEPTPKKETRRGLVQSVVRALTPRRFRRDR